MPRQAKTVFVLVNTTKTEVPVGKGKTKSEETYTYRSANGTEISFHAHPTKAWVYVIKAADQKLGLKLVNAYVKAALDREDSDDDKAAYNSAIRELLV